MGTSFKRFLVKNRLILDIADLMILEPYKIICEACKSDNLSKKLPPKAETQGNKSSFYLLNLIEDQKKFSSPDVEVEIKFHMPQRHIGASPRPYALH